MSEGFNANKTHDIFTSSSQKRSMTEDYHTIAFDIFNVCVYILIFHIAGFLNAQCFDAFQF